MKKGYLTLVFAIMTSSLLFSQNLVTIESLSAGFKHLIHEEVTFEGYIEKYVVGTATTSSYYEIKGEYGTVIRVNTSQPSPEINQRYRVQGTVTEFNGECLIIEKSKRKVNGVIVQGESSLSVIVSPQGTGTVVPSGNVDKKPGESIQLSASANRGYKFDSWTLENRVISTNQNFSFQITTDSNTLVANFKRDYTLYYIIGGGLLVVIIIVILILYLNKPKPVYTPTGNEKSEAFTGSGSQKVNEDIGGADTISFTTKAQEYDTIRIEQNVPPTMKFIPGSLEIASGPDKGKTIKIAGFPTPDGTFATIGKDHEGWEKLVDINRRYAHIRLKDESNTLSRMQAEFVYRGEKLYLKNLSKVNPTQVGGKEVPFNEVVEVDPNSSVKAGFIEFVYRKES